MPLPNLGPDYDMSRRLAELERLVRQLAANQLGQAFSATQSDGSVGMSIMPDQVTGAQAMRFYQGPATPRDPNTSLHQFLLYIGQLYSAGQSQDAGAIWQRPDGSQSQVIGKKGTQLFDAKGHQVFATDEYAASPSGEGLSEPWLPLPFPVPTGIGSWPKTAATSWGTVAQAEFIAQHAKVYHYAQTFADAGTNGQARVVIVDGGGNPVVTGATGSVTGGALSSITDTLTLPAGFWGQGYTMQLQCQVTSGTGSVYCQTFVAYGRGS